MNPLAANRSTPRLLPALQHLSYVEDLNWPAPRPVPDKKTPRPAEVLVPGRNGQWGGVTPTLH